MDGSHDHTPSPDPVEREPKDKGGKKKKSSRPKKDTLAPAPEARPRSPRPSTSPATAAEAGTPAPSDSPAKGLHSSQLREGMLYLQASLVKQMNEMFTSLKESLVQPKPAAPEPAPVLSACQAQPPARQDRGPPPPLSPQYGESQQDPDAHWLQDQAWPAPVTPGSSRYDSEEDEPVPGPSRPYYHQDPPHRVSEYRTPAPTTAYPPIPTHASAGAPEEAANHPDSDGEEVDNTLAQLFPAFPIGEEVEVGNQDPFQHCEGLQGFALPGIAAAIPKPKHLYTPSQAQQTLWSSIRDSEGQVINTSWIDKHYRVESGAFAAHPLPQGIILDKRTTASDTSLRKTQAHYGLLALTLTASLELLKMFQLTSDNSLKQIV